MACAEQRSYLIVHVQSRAVSMQFSSSLEYCKPVWMSSAESHMGLLDSVVHSAERFCDGKLICSGQQNAG